MSMPLELPKRVSTPEDIVKFFLYLTKIDRTYFHPDDSFYAHGEVQYSNERGPSYTPDQAKLRDRLMKQAFSVAHREGLDIYDIALFVVGAPGNEIEKAPEWLRKAMEEALRSRKRWNPELGAKGGPAKFTPDLEYLYHATTADRLPEIVERGLIPGLPSRWTGEFAEWSSGKLFFTMDLYISGQFVSNEMEREFERGEPIQFPVVLRASRKTLRGAREDMLWFNVYVKRRIAPEDLEIWLPWELEWAPLLEAYGQFEGKILGTPRTKEEFDRLHQEYFSSYPRRS